MKNYGGEYRHRLLLSSIGLSTIDNVIVVWYKSSPIPGRPTLRWPQNQPLATLHGVGLLACSHRVGHRSTSRIHHEVQFAHSTSSLAVPVSGLGGSTRDLYANPAGQVRDGAEAL